MVASYSYDTRDLAQFPHNGILGGVSLKWNGLGFNEKNYAILGIDFKEYRTFFEELITKWRFAYRTTFGNAIPYYDHSFLGLGEKVRGHYQDVREGKTSLITTVEFGYPIIKDFRLNFDFLPIIPNQLLRYRVGLYFQIFADAGTTFWGDENIGIKNFDAGYGAGLTFLILPYNIMRIEGALNKYNDFEWIIDLGISF